MTKPPTEAQLARALLEAERDFRQQMHAMLDDYLDRNDDGLTTIHRIMTNVIGGGMGMNIGVILIDPEPNAVEEHAEKSGIEIVRA